MQAAARGLRGSAPPAAGGRVPRPLAPPLALLPPRALQRRARCPCRAARAVRVEAAKGFGSGGAAKKQKPPKQRTPHGGGAGGSAADVDGEAPQHKAVQQALRAAGAARPVDPREASRGRLDVATVKDWGSGSPGDLGELAVLGVATRFDAAADRPLSVQLARLLEQLEAQGALKLADGGRPLPPFQRWSLTRARYAQYLSDLAAAHGALEAALAAALAAAGPGSGGGAVGPSAPVAAALGRLGCGCGLHRAEQVAADLTALVAAQARGDGGGAPGSGTNSSGGSSGGSGAPAAGAPAPDGGATALAAYVSQLGAAASSPASSAAERDRAALRLLAAAYSLLAAFLSVGARVGAAAAERAGAAAAGALAAYTQYPGLEGGGGGGDPAAALVAAVDAAGADLTPEQRQVVFDELPRAFPKAALLVAALAHED
ncbi:MAG: hypothetical protein J3K34DRAFT_515843 [Monoraphidium minutum]|nr:MAG: hypothetical protein J3K34DRAFT_515843 [Monoraphidium minutum]